METKDFLRILQREIHSAVFATVDEGGFPQTCVIDLMLSDEDGLYFLTAKGKSFYERLTRFPFVAVGGVKGDDTLSAVAVSVRGKVRNIGQHRLNEIFRENPYMAKIYPTEKSREALVVFQIYQGDGEYFDLSQLPPFRQAFSFGGQALHEYGYQIDAETCTGCRNCIEVCPSNCISGQIPCVIETEHCLHCGNCYSICPVKAVKKVGRG